MNERNKQKTMYKILQTINSKDHVTSSTIASSWGMSNKHVVFIVGELEDAEFITKSGNDDKRLRILKITSEGKNFLDSMDRFYKKKK